MNNQEKLLLNKRKYKNEIFETSKYGKVEVLTYKNKKEVIIKFVDTGNVTIVTLNNLINDRVKDGYAKTICGVGFLGDMKNPYTVNRRLYDIWRQMLRRCYDETLHSIRPTYKGCTVSENFKNFSYFISWYHSQIGYDQDNWCLDKDILIKGNKIYSEDTCCLVPYEINNLVVKSDKCRGEYLIGTSFVKKHNKYKSGISKNGVLEHLGTYNTQEEAFLAYKQAKEGYIKEVANKWKDQIDHRVYEALMNYQVEITD